MIKYLRLVVLDNESMATGSHPVNMKEHLIWLINLGRDRCQRMSICNQRILEFGDWDNYTGPVLFIINIKLGLD